MAWRRLGFRLHLDSDGALVDAKSRHEEQSEDTDVKARVSRHR